MSGGLGVLDLEHAAADDSNDTRATLELGDSTVAPAAGFTCTHEQGYATALCIKE